MSKPPGWPFHTTTYYDGRQFPSFAFFQKPWLVRCLNPAPALSFAIKREWQSYYVDALLNLIP